MKAMGFMPADRENFSVTEWEQRRVITLFAGGSACAATK